MVRVAVVEDDRLCAERTRGYIEDFGKESGEAFAVTLFGDGLELLDGYRPVFDIIFMDIEMPDLDGMETARRLRALDPVVILIFVTNMAQYAIKGYEVEALDYMVKPIGYFNFTLKLKKALRKLGRVADVSVSVPQESGVMRLNSSQIRYVEVINHNLVFHTDTGEYEARGSLTETEKLLGGHGFSRCNHCYLVNLKYVSGIRSGFAVMVSGDALQISRPKKKAFLDALAGYRGGVR